MDHHKNEINKKILFELIFCFSLENIQFAVSLVNVGCEKLFRKLAALTFYDFKCSISLVFNIFYSFIIIIKSNDLSYFKNSKIRPSRNFPHRKNFGS